MGVEEGGPSEGDLKIRPGEPETRLPDVHKAQDQANESNDARKWAGEATKRADEYQERADQLQSNGDHLFHPYAERLAQGERDIAEIHKETIKKTEKTQE